MKVKPLLLLPGAIALIVAASPFMPSFTDVAVAGYGEMGGRGMKANQLNLTDAQKAEMKKIRQSTRQQIDNILTAEQKETLRTARQQRQKPNLNLTEDQKAKIKAVRQDAKSRMEALLTAEQKQKLQELRSQWRQRRQQQQS